MNLLLQLEVEVERFRKNLNRCISNNLPCEEIINETERLKAQLKDCYFQPGSKLKFRKFTEFHLIKLSEILEIIRDAAAGIMAARSEQPAEVILDEIMPDVLVVYHKVRALLAFVYEVFGKYLPKNHFIPAVSHQNFIKEVLGYKEEISKKLRHLDGQLTQLLLIPFANFVQLPELRTWHQIDYCRALHSEFQELSVEGTAIGAEELMRFLVRVNYNSPDYYNFCIGVIKKDQAYPSITRLEQLKKEVGQIQVLKGMQYRRDMKSIKKQIQSWLNAEIQYWKALELEKEVEETKEPISPDKPGVSGGKINTRLTEEVLALKTAVELEADLFYGKGHPKPILQKTLETYNTINREHLTYESFRKRFYERKIETAKAYRKFQLECLRITNNIITSRGGSLN